MNETTTDSTGDGETPPAVAVDGVQPQQGEMPFAVVMGQAVTELPKDLYIPPQALEIILEAFEGPFDLLLYLIKRQNLDILEIDVSQDHRAVHAVRGADGRHEASSSRRSTC